ncbi:hypothetical protein BKA64DRAFT_655494 [Cadophora sp. MPI-SDFR-AT-0126]|nr:hypothetical protein BKA61DRAFT_562089 [Leptodontidium sp. MPI-SDFR-AT-0119]KAH7418885.1 hypothetical protein BKA64DRAFT_655494 [Leotiomycetes sp. MPI-SDFR-AT-0126]
MNSYLLQFLEWFYRDSVQCPDFRPRDRPMEILALGVSRSGTDSLKHALEVLGYEKVYHGFDLLAAPEQLPFWREATKAKFEGGKKFTRDDWDRIFGNCRAISDLPAIMFAKELIEAYPEAKIILSTRDLDAWHRSVALSIDANAHDKVRHFMQLFHPLTFQYTVLTKIYHMFFRGDFKNQGRNVYEEYNAMIRGLAPKDRFLEYHVSEGWEPLCEFLGKDVPKREMPNENSGKVFQGRFEKIQGKWKREIYWNIGKCLGTVAFIGLAVGSFFWRDLLFEKLKRLEGLRRFAGIVKTVRYK